MERTTWPEDSCSLQIACTQLCTEKDLETSSSHLENFKILVMQDLLDPNKSSQESVMMDCDQPGAAAESPEKLRPRNKKKSTMLKTVELSNFLVDNELRSAIGMMKVSNRQVVLAQPKAQATSQGPTHKGIRREKKPTTTKKIVLEARKHIEKEENNVELTFIPTPLDECVIELLKKLKKQANAAHKANPIRARSKRTFICGIHECLKHIQADNVKCVLLARNMDAEMEGVTLLQSIRDECGARGIPIIHASTKRLLSRALEKFPYTNVVGLLRFQGFEEIYDKMISLWNSSDSHIKYHKDQSSLFARVWKFNALKSTDLFELSSTSQIDYTIVAVARLAYLPHLHYNLNRVHRSQRLHQL
ncbi:unnamed protein product [Cylicocyclus nassatus]|uniref:Ribosomal protein eL8/eL30/eS12/Gadd45 domain-containing protein n=1 Tax=Cylicocyclus nassatus TaxID=53992 RepID=A0AA36M1B3_CYLNA|nr:unnamed protein product [Cylicocyclus nassatus]